MELDFLKSKLKFILLMAEILHQLICSFSHYLQGCIHPRWWRISSINSSFSIFLEFVVGTETKFNSKKHNGEEKINTFPGQFLINNLAGKKHEKKTKQGTDVFSVCCGDQ